MKNTTLKMLGVVLTLAMLCGLLMAVAPVSTSAANLSWSNYTMAQVTVGTSANVYAFTGDGKTIFAWTAGTVNPTSTTTGKFYKSTDGGMTWTNSSLDNTTPVIISASGVVITKLAVNPSNTNDIVAAGYDGSNVAHVYRSINAGQTFYPFDPSPAPGNVITGLDVANGSSGLVAILVSYAGGTSTTPNSSFAGGIALFDSSIGTWRTTNLSSNPNFSGALGSNVTWGISNGLAAAFSPNYANDAAIVVVSANATPNLSVRGMIVATGSDWNQGGGIKDANLKVASNQVLATNYQIASLAMPSDFVPTSTVQNRVFVGIGELAGGTNGNNANDVYRVNGGTSSSSSYALGASVNVSDVAYAGTAQAGQLVAGQYAGTNTFPTGSPVLSTNQVTNNSPTWNSSANSPSGYSASANTQVKFVPGATATSYTLYAGTAGTASALSSSTDSNSFWGLGLISVSSYANISLGNSSGRGTSTVMQVVKESSNAMGFISLDGGTTWKEFLNNGPVSFSFYKSPAYATDKTIYLSQTDTSATSIDDSKQIVKSSDGGLTWTILNTPSNVSLNWMAPIDANSYWIASVDRIQNSSSSTYATIGGNTPNQIFVFPGMFVVTTKNTGEVWVSTDSGITFNRLGNASQFPSFGGQTGGVNNNSAPGPNGVPNPITFDVPNKTIYVADLATHNIDKWAVGTDSSWQVYLNSSSLPAQLQGQAAAAGTPNHPISALSLGTDGIWYITSNNNYDIVNSIAVSNPQIWYTSDLLNIQFSPLLQSDIAGLGGSLPFPFLPGQTKDATGNTVFYCGVVQGTDGTNGFFTTSVTSTSTVTQVSPNGYPNDVMVFTNTLSTGPKITAPDGKTAVGTPVNSTNGNFDQVNFSWTAVTYNNPKYHFQVAYDKTFNNIASTANNSNMNTYSSSGVSSATTTLDLNYLPSNGVAAVPLSPGQTYYWRVRTEYPVVSKWSDPIQFSTVVSALSIVDVGRINPSNGATNVPVTPVITWGTVSGSTGYDFKLATDAAFTQTVDTKTNIQTTAYSPSAPLKTNTTYFWEVRALNGTAASDWVVSAFTTATSATPVSTGGAPPTTAAPNPPQTIVVTIPPQPQQSIVVTIPNTPAPAPTTPPYIWVIIAIGAVLVIAVIVLIARTRRV